MKGQVIYIFLISSLDFLCLKEKYFRTTHVPKKNKHLVEALTLKMQVFRVWKNTKDNLLIYLAMQSY